MVSSLSNFSFLHTFVLLGVLQGFILSALLFFEKRVNPLANRLLAFLLLCLSLACTDLYLEQSELYSFTAIKLLVVLLPLNVPTLVATLLYLYVQALLNPQLHISKKHWLLFLPLLIDLIPKLIAWCYAIGLLLNWIHYSAMPKWGAVIETYQIYADLPRWLTLTFFLFLAGKEIKKAKGALSADASKNRWIRMFAGVFAGFQLIWLLFLIPYLSPFGFTMLDYLNWYPVYIPLVAVIYWIGLRGYFFSCTYTPSVRGKSKEISPKKVQSVACLLHQAMEQEELYLEAELSVKKLAVHIGVEEKVISMVLNSFLQKSFNTFINEYRVEKVKLKMLDPSTKHLTLTGIAFECGFNSQATFQRAFRSITGLAPGEFLAIETKKQNSNAQIRI